MGDLMRKRNLDKLFDNIFWYAIYLMPLFVILAVYACPAIINLPFDEYTIFDIAEKVFVVFGCDEGIIYDFLSTCVEYITGYARTSYLVCMCNYFIIAVCLHLIVDFVLFIPRIAHKYMDKFVRSE